MPYGYFLLAVLVVVLPSVLGNTCDGANEEPTIEKDVYYSTYVIMGRVNKKIEDIGSDIYSANVDVLCTYKGSPIAESIMVKNAGKKNKGCPSQDLEKGALYALFLDKNMEPTYRPLKYPDDSAIIDDLRAVCDIVHLNPEGNAYSGHADDCPAPYGDSDCYRFDPPSPEPGSEPETTAEPESKPEGSPEGSPEVTSEPGNKGYVEAGSPENDSITHLLSPVLTLLTLFLAIVQL